MRWIGTSKREAVTVAPIQNQIIVTLDLKNNESYQCLTADLIIPDVCNYSFRIQNGLALVWRTEKSVPGCFVHYCQLTWNQTVWKLFHPVWLFQWAYFFLLGQLLAFLSFPLLVQFYKTLNFSAWSPVLLVSIRFSLSVCLEWFQNGQMSDGRECGFWVS